MVVIRREIYTAKCNDCLPVFDNIVSAIKCYYDMEKYIAKTNLRERKFSKRKKMVSFYHLLLINNLYEIIYVYT